MDGGDATEGRAGHQEPSEALPRTTLRDLAETGVTRARAAVDSMVGARPLPCLERCLLSLKRISGRYQTRLSFSDHGYNPCRVVHDDP